MPFSAIMPFSASTIGASSNCATVLCVCVCVCMCVCVCVCVGDVLRYQLHVQRVNFLSTALGLRTNFVLQRLELQEMCA